MKHVPYFLLRPSRPRLPVLISSPHSGTDVPAAIATRMNALPAADLPDTDWLIHELYHFASALGITIIHARYSRYVIDLNRDPAGQALYRDGRQETSLVPVRTFADEPIYKTGQEPNTADVAERLETYFEPYHKAVAAELQDLRREFKHVLFFDAHSIARLVKTIRPTPFPDLILGNQKGRTAAPSVINAALTALRAHGHYDVSHNDPFMGGYLTRSCGQPEKGIHALQLEMSQDVYMRDIANPSRAGQADRAIDPQKRERLIPTLQRLFLDVVEALKAL